MKNFINVVYSTHLDDDYNNKFDLIISNSIGVKHKIIRYINKNTHSLAEVYNKALNEHNKKDSIFVFVHNDIIFKTKNWGRILLNKFNNSDFDIIGVAGTKKIGNDGIWWTDKLKLYGIVEHTDGYKDWKTTFSDSLNRIEEVVAIDGVFMAVNPDTIINKFDESFKGFHFYDIPFCVENYLDGCNIGVTTDIRILHKSVGMVNDKWDLNRIQFIEKYKNELPLEVNYEIKDLNYPKINVDKLDKYNLSIIIPTKNNFTVLNNCIQSILTKTSFKNYEIIIADTGSDDETKRKYKDIYIFHDKFKIVYYNYYNFSKINNDVVKNHATGNMLLFINDDVELINDAISIMLNHYHNMGNVVGTIGCRLHYYDNSIQHNGIIIGLNSEKKMVVTHRNLNQIDRYPTNFREVIASTGAFLMVSLDRFKEAGMFNENYIECFEDVELNLQLIKLKYNNYIASDAVAYHYESLSRRKNENMNENVGIDYKKLLNFVKTDDSSRKNQTLKIEY